MSYDEIVTHLCKKLDEQGEFMLGMSFNPKIPREVREALKNQFEDIQKITSDFILDWGETK